MTSGSFLPGYFENFFEGYSVSPGCPDNPVLRTFGGHGLTGLSDREVTLFF
jgi:hypothetical protein